MGFGSLVSKHCRIPGVVGALGVSRLGGPSNEVSGLGRTVLNVRLRAHGALSKNCQDQGTQNVRPRARRCQDQGAQLSGPGRDPTNISLCASSLGKFGLFHEINKAWALAWAPTCVSEP